MKSLLCLLFLSFSLTCFTQSNSSIYNRNKHYLGGMVGYGNQGLTHQKYSYHSALFYLYYSYETWSTKTWSLEATLKPQFNLVQFGEYKAPDTSAYEFGISPGIRINKYLKNERLGFYIELTMGPHYVSDTPERQTPGFLISSGIVGGMKIALKENTYLDLHYTARHLSNGNGPEPNGGVNIGIYSAGLIFRLAHKSN